MQIILTALEKEYNGMEASFDILRGRYKHIMKRHNSFSADVWLIRYTIGKMLQLGDEMGNIGLSSLWHFSRHSHLAMALEYGSWQDLLVRKQDYEESYKSQMKLLKGINKLMETALGSCAA